MKKKIKTALITGVLGQDAAYLVSFLIKKKYKIIGIDKNKLNNKNCWRLKKLKVLNKIIFEKINLNSKNQIQKILKKYNINEVYNLASISSVSSSIKFPLKSIYVNGILVIKILEAIKNTNPKIKFYQASSSEMFGCSLQDKQNEKTPLNPLSPYAASKTLAHNFVKYYRSAHNLYAVSGILFNHESPLRGKEFVTKKISQALVKIIFGYNNIIKLGNIYTKRDWGYAKDYVRSMWKMLQQKKPRDYVISTGKNYTVKDFINECVTYLKIKTKWIGKGFNERLINISTGKNIIQIDKKLFRPLDLNYSKGDSSKAKKILNWKPKAHFKKLVTIMLNSEIHDFYIGGHGKN